MIEINLMTANSALLITLGVLFHLLALAKSRPRRRTMGNPPYPSEGLTPEAASDIQVAFAALAVPEGTFEYEATSPVEEAQIPPGDLAKTLKLPALVQSFKFREKQNQPAT